jgi:hypothetical protein
MSEEPALDSTPRQRPGWGWLVWMLVGLALYALSVGPVAKFCPSPSPALQNFYAPLAFTYSHVKPVKIFYDWYAGLWGVHL